MEYFEQLLKEMLTHGTIPCAPVPPSPIKPPPNVGILGLAGFLAGLRGLRALRGFGGACLEGDFFFIYHFFFLEYPPLGF